LAVRGPAPEPPTFLRLASGWGKAFVGDQGIVNIRCTGMFNACAQWMCAKLEGLATEIEIFRICRMGAHPILSDKLQCHGEDQVGTEAKLTVGLTSDFQTVGYVHLGNEVFIRAGAH
jgi:hypothetical protein